MNTKKMAAILGTCLLLISGCSTSIPISNEQISRDIISSKLHFTGNSADHEALKDNLAAYGATMIDLSQGSHCFKITDDNMTTFEKKVGFVYIDLYHRDGYGQVNLEYKKEDDKWVFQKLSIVNTPKFKLTKGGKELNDSSAKPFCDNFDSSKAKK